MTEGLKSYLFGCHHFFFHPLWVWIAWTRHYGKVPKLWQTICILIHDVGICDYNFLSHTKNGHWKRGAKIAYKLFGMKGWLLCAGHTRQSGWPLSDLFIADKKSRLIEPIFYMRYIHFMEGFNFSPEVWREVVRKNLASADCEKCQDNHTLFLKLRKEVVRN